DEIQRQHAIEREKVAVRERELEAERQRIVSDQERMRQVALEEERKRIEVEIRAKHAAEVERQKKEVQRIEEESRRLHARKQQEMEVEMQRIEEEARQRQILIERQRQMDQQDMRERIQQQQLQLQQQQQQQLQPQEQQVRISMAELFGAATGSADSQRNNTSWQMSFPSDSNEGTPKTAPWNKTPGSPLKTPAKTTPAPSLLDIQLEEERQLKAEQRQKKQQDAHKRNNLPNAEATGVWGNSTQRLTWGQNAGTPPSVNSGPSAWGNAASKQPEPSSHGFWDADPAPAPQQPAAKKEKKKDNTKAAKSKAQKPAGNQKDSQQESVKKLFQSASTTQDPFLSWVVKRVTQLNKDVDAEVFATFIEGVESPVDVEDYIVGYLGEGRPAKDFLREFLEKRSETRARKLDTDRDDMSMPAAALTKEEQASAAAAAAIAAGNRKKKRGKGGQKLLVDGSHLGFTATSDPNRLNVGDIDTIQ
uniref:PERQ amino acid-rich with GYF domain-containing protein 2 n=1 Tax=Plectus sambesii TaxID=2011161 RepID=A0A914UI12_9BILA